MHMYIRVMRKERMGNRIVCQGTELYARKQKGK